MMGYISFCVGTPAITIILGKMDLPPSAMTAWSRIIESEGHWFEWANSSKYLVRVEMVGSENVIHFGTTCL